MNKYVAAVLGGGFCWGFMGFFTRHLAEYGIDANGAIVVRCGIAAVCFGILIADAVWPAVEVRLMRREKKRRKARKTKAAAKEDTANA